MAETRSEVRDEIELKKAAIDDKMSRLEQRVESAKKQATQALSFEHHMHERPWTVMAGALGAGLIMGRLGQASRAAHKAAEPPPRPKRASKPKKRSKHRNRDLRSRPPSPPSETDDLAHHAKKLFVSAVVPGLLSAVLRSFQTSDTTDNHQ